jgi:Na+-driven multidrug efflux pump
MWNQVFDPQLLVQTAWGTLAFLLTNSVMLFERRLLALGQDGHEGLAGIGLGWSLAAVITFGVLNVVNIVAPWVGQHLGEGNTAAAYRVTGQAIRFSVACIGWSLGVAVIASLVMLGSGGATSQAASYFALNVLSLPFQLVSAAVTAFYAGSLRIRRVALITACSTGANLILASLFVRGWEWGVPGAGFARLIAGVVGAGVGMTMFLCEATLPAGSLRKNPELFGLLVSRGGRLGLQQAAANVIVAGLYLGAQHIDDTYAGALAATHSGWYPLLFVPFLAISQTVTAASSKALGRRDPAAAARVTWAGLTVSALIGLLAWACVFRNIAAVQGVLLPGTYPTGAMTAATRRLMLWLILFSVADVPINLASALLRSIELDFLVGATLAIAGLFCVAAPTVLWLQPDNDLLMGCFVGVQAMWAGLLMGRLLDKSWMNSHLTDRTCDEAKRPHVAAQEERSADPISDGQVVKATHSGGSL